MTEPNQAEAFLHFERTITSILRPIFELSRPDFAADAKTQTESRLNSLMGDVRTKLPRDECESLTVDRASALLSICHEFSTTDAKVTFEREKNQNAASTAFQNAQEAWRAALRTYESAVSAAQIDLNFACELARNTYAKHFKDDSEARDEEVAARMETSIATALTTYEAAADHARSSLAQAACTSLMAYVQYTSATLGTQLASAEAQAHSKEKFWQSVYGIRDA